MAGWPYRTFYREKLRLLFRPLPDTGVSECLNRGYLDGIIIRLTICGCTSLSLSRESNPIKGEEICIKRIVNIYVDISFRYVNICIVDIRVSINIYVDVLELV